MNKEKLVSCETLEQCVNEILRKSMIVNESVGFYDYKGGRSKTNGLYLKINKKKINSGFDTLVYGLVYGYLDSIEYRLEGNINEFANDSIWDAIVMVQEVMLDWANGRYCNVITPKDVEDLVDIVFDEEKSQNVCNYLFGIIKRLAKNLLFCSAKYDNNNFTVNPRKISMHTTNKKDGTQKWIYEYVELNSVDKTYECDNIFGVDTRVNILDKYYFDNNMSTTLYESEDNVYGKLEAILQFFNPNKREKIRKTFENEENISYKDAVDSSCRLNLKKQCMKDASYRNVKFDKNGNILYAGDFVDFSFKLMQSQDLCEKFNMIKKALKRNDCVGNTLMDIILELDYEIYHTFFQHLKDSKYVKYYVKSEGFRVILNAILEEYKGQQNRFKEIYCYNETQRLEKIDKLRNKLLNSIRNDGSIDIVKINRVYLSYIEEFDLMEYNSKLQLNKIENKITAIRNIGFEMEKVNNRKYLLKEVS